VVSTPTLSFVINYRSSVLHNLAALLLCFNMAADVPFKNLTSDFFQYTRQAYLLWIVSELDSPDNNSKFI